MEVKGSSRKLHRQKGTGGSRKGNIRNPLYKGGGTIFGPKPHGYEIKVNRKVKDLAKIGALAYKAKENAIMIIEDIIMDKPKTSQFTGVMKGLGVSDKKTLFVYPEYNDNMYLSLRNIPNADGTVLSDIHTYEIMNAEVMVITESAAKIFVEAEPEVAA
jgi:large subunit ribosomal protein L4